MVRILKGFHLERGLRYLSTGITIVQAQDYYPNKRDADYSARDDSPWIRRFAADGGRVVISGDARMMTKPHERLALLECELTTIFFASPWHGWKFCRKCALVMHWWPALLDIVRNPEPGFFRVPKSWPDEPDAKLQSLPTEDLKMTKIKWQLANRDAVRATRARQRDESAATRDMLDGPSEALQPIGDVCVDDHGLGADEAEQAPDRITGKPAEEEAGSETSAQVK